MVYLQQHGYWKITMCGVYHLPNEQFAVENLMIPIRHGMMMG
jgi:hypothetical protein